VQAAAWARSERAPHPLKLLLVARSGSATTRIDTLASTESIFADEALTRNSRPRS
jgi:hypothetical protein